MPARTSSRRRRRAPAGAPRRALLLLCCLCLALCIAPRGAAAAPAGAGGRELTFWVVGANLDDVALYRRLAEDFRARTGVGVRITPLGWGDFDTKYFAAMAAQLPPDVGMTGLDGPMSYGAVGGLVDLQREFPGEVEELKARFYPDILPRVSFRGQLFGVPTDVGTLLLYYRRDILERLAVKVPATWSELSAAIRAIEARGMRFYFGWTRREQWSSYLYTLPFGLTGVSFDGQRAPRLQWGDPAYQRGVLFALELWNLHENLGEGQGGLGERNIGRFLSDDPAAAIPLLVDGSWSYQSILNRFPAEAHKWDIAPWPRADGGAPVNVIGGTAYVIFSKSRNRRAAFDFVRYMNSLPVQRAILLDRMDRGKDATFTVSPLRALWDESGAAEAAEFWRHPALQRSQRLRQVMAEVVPTFRTFDQALGRREFVDLLEGRVLDRVGGYMLDELSALARSKDLGRFQLLQALGRGELAAEERALRERVAARLAREYAAEVKEGQAILLREERQYQQRYADVITHLRDYEGRPDVLRYLEWAAALLLLLGAGLVLGTRRGRAHRDSYLFVLAPVALSLVFVFLPALTAFYLSFTEYHPVLPLSTARPVGLRQYAEVLSSGEVLRSLLRTAAYVVVTVPVGVLLSLSLAALLNRELAGGRLLRFVYFSPFVTSAVSVALIFAQLYQGSELGWLNALLLRLHLTRDPIAFLSRESTFLPCVMGLAIWHGLAFSILVFLAALQQVPQALYRAAEVDGAGWLRKFWHVSLPGIRPQIIFVTIMGVIGGFQVFEPIYMLGGGSGYAGAKFGPNDAGLTMVPAIYHEGFETFRMGRAAATAYLLFALILIFTVLQFRLTRGPARAQGKGRGA